MSPSARRPRPTRRSPATPGAAADPAVAERLDPAVRDDLPFADTRAQARWGSLDPQDLILAAAADPVGFVADHLPGSDRRAGSVAVLIDCGSSGPRLVNCVHDAPVNPGPDECRAVLDAFVDIALELRQPGDTPSIGVVVHRRGNPVPVAMDRQWVAALRDAASDAGIHALGYAARTIDGSLVRLPVSLAA